jgi:hypothetical protein
MTAQAKRGGSGNAAPPNRVGLASESDDPRLESFIDFLDALDRADWRKGQLATRRLRSLGISVCLVTPPERRLSP